MREPRHSSRPDENCKSVKLDIPYFDRGLVMACLNLCNLLVRNDSLSVFMSS